MPIVCPHCGSNDLSCIVGENVNQYFCNNCLKTTYSCENHIPRGNVPTVLITMLRRALWNNIKGQLYALLEMYTKEVGDDENKFVDMFNEIRNFIESMDKRFL